MTKLQKQILSKLTCKHVSFDTQHPLSMYLYYYLKRFRFLVNNYQRLQICTLLRRFSIDICLLTCKRQTWVQSSIVISRQGYKCKQAESVLCITETLDFCRCMHKYLIKKKNNLHLIIKLYFWDFPYIFWDTLFYMRYFVY